MRFCNSEEFTVIGISGRERNDQPAGIGELWARFHAQDILADLPGAKSADIHCVYHSYAGTQTDPYEMTIGYAVPRGTACPEGLICVDIPGQKMAVFDADGEQPATLMQQWQAIWGSNLDRAFVADFDVYDASKPARVTVYVGIKSE